MSVLAYSGDVGPYWSIVISTSFWSYYQNITGLAPISSSLSNTRSTTMTDSFPTEWSVGVLSLGFGFRSTTW